RLMQLKTITRPASIQDDLLWDLLLHLLDFDRKTRFSAEQALQHPYFTSFQALNDISDDARSIAASALQGQQVGDRSITAYDTDVTYTVSGSEIKKAINYNPDVDLQPIYNQIPEYQHSQFNSSYIQSLSNQVLKNPVKQFKQSYPQAPPPVIPIAPPSYIPSATQTQLSEDQQLQQQQLIQEIKKRQNPIQDKEDSNQQFVQTENQNIPEDVDISSEQQIPCDICKQLIRFSEYEQHQQKHKNEIEEQRKEKKELKELVVELMDTITDYWRYLITKIIER
ncbi:MAG: hypothetical protein EZS28_047765, partial [Streblomastix strix]